MDPSHRESRTSLGRPFQLHLQLVLPCPVTSPIDPKLRVLLGQWIANELRPSTVLPYAKRVDLVDADVVNAFYESVEQITGHAPHVSHPSETRDVSDQIVHLLSKGYRVLAMLENEGRSITDIVYRQSNAYCMLVDVVYIESPWK